MTQIIVYTCIVGGYDQLLDQPVEPGVKYICFTDETPPRSACWEIRPLLSPTSMQNSTLINRFHKVKCYDSFADVHTTIYLDGNVQLQKPPSEILKPFKERNGVIAGLSHRWRNSAASELEACSRKLSPEQMSRARELLAKHRDQGFLDDRGLTANYLLVRDTRSERLKRSMDRWWECIQDFVPRDQLSLQYSLWAERIDMLRLDDEISCERIARRVRHLPDNSWTSRGLLRWLRRMSNVGRTD